MGTNYYLEYSFCKCCGKPNKTIHLGKSSSGWKFLIQKQPGITNYEELKDKITEGIIKDEYGEVYSPEELLRIIESKQGQQPHSYNDSLACENIDGYDFQEYEFS